MNRRQRPGAHVGKRPVQENIRHARDLLRTPAVCETAGRHRVDQPFIMCEHCGTIRWNGIDLCGKLVHSRVLIVNLVRGSAAQDVHACTRAKDHPGDCKYHPLPNSRRGEDPKSYTPS